VPGSSVVYISKVKQNFDEKKKNKTKKIDPGNIGLAGVYTMKMT